MAKEGMLTDSRFKSFEEYVESEGHGISLQKAREKVKKGALFMQQIERGDVNIGGTREENMANLVWFLTARSFGSERGRPMDAGMYTIGFDGNKRATKRLNDYFAGKNSKSHPVMRMSAAIIPGIIAGVINIIPAFGNIIRKVLSTVFQNNKLLKKSIPYFTFADSINWLSKKTRGGKEALAYNPNRLAYGRSSSHFKKVTESHFGYDMRHAKNQLPGKFCTVVFGYMKDGRMYLKPEEHGVDPLYHPGESVEHGLSFTGAIKASPKELTQKEKYVNLPAILRKYEEMVGKPENAKNGITIKYSEKNGLTIDEMRKNIQKEFNKFGPEVSRRKVLEFDSFVQKYYGKEGHSLGIAPQHGSENSFMFNRIDLDSFRKNIKKSYTKPGKTPYKLQAHALHLQKTKAARKVVGYRYKPTKLKHKHN